MAKRSRTTTEDASNTSALAARRFAEQIREIEIRAGRSAVLLPRGATPRKLERAERALGTALPPEMRAFYTEHDGGSRAGEANCGVGSRSGGRTLLSLDGIVSEWRKWMSLIEAGALPPPAAGTRSKLVRTESSWIAGWIPITSDGAGTHHVVDLAPAPRGRVGQVFSFFHDSATKDAVEAPDFLTWLAAQAWGDDGDEEDARGPWRRLETGSKFWECCRDDFVLYVRFGPLRARGREVSHTLGDAAECAAKARQLVAEKLAKGYVEVVEAGPRRRRRGVSAAR